MAATGTVPVAACGWRPAGRKGDQVMNSPTLPRRICRRCLLREMDETEYFDNLHTYIRNLDEDLKVCDEIYAQRLAECKSCDSLLSGMCRICGCYVELRAVMKKNICPLVRPRWGAVKDKEDYANE